MASGHFLSSERGLLLAVPPLSQASVSSFYIGNQLLGPVHLVGDLWEQVFRFLQTVRPLLGIQVMLGGH